MPANTRMRPIAADVASVVGHEMGTPIATALLYLGIADCHCASGSPVSFVRAALAVARVELQRLKSTLDRMTEIERFGQAVIRPKSIDLASAVRGTVVRMLEAEATAVDNVEVHARGNLVGWWDDGAVEQIVRNLLSNAIKFGLDREIHISAAPTPEGARISVTDNGIGIRAGERERIFERSTCAPPERGGGLGIGLWLVRELAEAHGGHVEVRSRLGHGSTFTVLLPEIPPLRVRRPPRRPGVGASLTNGRAPTLRAGASDRKEFRARRSL